MIRKKLIAAIAVGLVLATYTFVSLVHWQQDREAFKQRMEWERVTYCQIWATDHKKCLEEKNNK